MKTSLPTAHLLAGLCSSLKTAIVTLLVLLVLSLTAKAQSFVHPGGLHTLADLDRMKAKVAAGAHPWIDDWNMMINDSRAKNTYTPTPLANLGDSRNQADFDAHAAYLNAIRWYISGDVSYADCAVRICNAWSAAVNQVPTGADIPGLNGLPTCNFALAAEILRLYPGWDAADFDRFKNMMITYLYPACNDFLLNHQGSCATHFFANWDLACIEALMAIGVLCDDAAKYNQGVDYFKNGIGNGNIERAVYYIHPGNLGQWQESGRDQGHTQLGIGLAGYICQIAWNQGLDLFAYDNNRVLAGAEYVAQYNLWQDVPFQYYNDCVNDNHFYVATNSRGASRPVWELIYNHYAVLKGLPAPNCKLIAQVQRPEPGAYLDHFGYGTLAFTLDDAASPYPPSPTPPTPAGLTATASVSRIDLQWTPSAGYTAQGYRVQRSTTSGGPYTTIASWKNNTSAQYTDLTAVNDVTYYYVVATINQSGTSSNSAEVSATPKATSTSLLAGWTSQDVGGVITAGSTTYASVGNNTFLVNGSGNGIGSVADSYLYAYTKATGDITISARLLNVAGTLSKTGIMIRESLSAGAKALFIKLGDVGWRIAGFGTRASTDGSMTWKDGDKFTWIPVWLRLQRVGNTFTAFQSSDGVTWFAIGTSTVAMDNVYYVGLAASSGSSTGALDNSTFDNMTIQGTLVVLPVSLLNFSAMATGDQSLLTWQTSTDPYSGSFTIQRSSDGANWQTIGAVIADANCTASCSYRFTDKQPLTGINYYRLAWVSTTGQPQYSKVDAVSFSVNYALTWYLSGKQAITVQLRNGSHEKYKLSGIDGRVWQQGILQNGLARFNQLTPGVYIIQVIVSGGTITEKISVP